MGKTGSDPFGSMVRTNLQGHGVPGACCVTSYDALSGLESFDSLRARIAAGWAKNE
ncbi:MAG: hypothetical protein LUI87_19795 [Lachnospiraceae bacterium]|nr:hypothetical protein [Lachnospiraceae bacterium]